MQKLEAEIARVDSRTKAVESNTTEHNISALVEQVRALAEDGGKNEADKLRQEIMTRFESVGAEMEAIVQRVSDIEDQEQHDKEKWEREHEVQDSLLKRVEYVESNLQEYASALKKLGRKMDDAQTDKAWTMLAELKDQVKTGQSGLESVAEHMGILEEVSQELKAQNVKLAEQFEELAQRPVSDTEPVAGPAVAARSATRGRTPVSNETPTPSPESKKRATVKTKTKTKTATSLRAKQSDASGAKQFAKPAPTGVKKSRAPVAAKPKSEATVAAPNRDARLGPVQKRKAGKDLDSSIVRSGPGWVEVAESSDDDENEKDNGLEGYGSIISSS
jgi:DNA repair exonuclease SbcCD ATPase subunit